ncbi:MAG: cation-translocating P-type ATPase [Rikenellaceae bacterium]
MTKINGLTPDQVTKSRSTHGPNTITPPKREPLWKLLLEKFNDPVIKILIVAAFLSLGISILHGEYYETIGIFAAIILSTSIAFFFERDAAKKFELLNKINEETLYKVYRGGTLNQIAKQDLVVGDIIVLDTGEEIPADAILIESTELSVNESTLTGEIQIDKTTLEEDFDSEATYPSNHILRSTTILEGSCMAEITRVGDSTEFGKVAQLSSKKVNESTPLTKQLEKLSSLIGVVGFAIAFLTFSALTIQSVFWGNLSSATLGQKGLLGAALLGALVMLGKLWIPIVFDGLKLAGKKKELPPHVKKMGFWYWIIMGLMAFGAIALLGLPFGVKATDINYWITLDMAQEILNYFMMCVTLIVVAVPEGLPMSVTLSLALSMRKMLKANNLVRKMHASETIGATTVICTDKTGTLTKNEMRVADFQTYIDDEELLQRAIALNSTANLDVEGKPVGNPTEGALLLWLKDKGVDYSSLREGKEAQMPFSSKIKMMATVATIKGKKLLVVKGAPEYVLANCTEGNLESAKAKLLEYQNKAMRTLAFAIKEYSGGEIEESLEGLTLQGIAAIADPVRDDVPQAVANCFSAGVAIKMVTGDTTATAREIARQIGLWDDATDSELSAITGPEWEALSDEEAYERAPMLKIMARARPQDKQRLVQLLQKRGEVVAVTGDGTNDAPALNFANVGLSMGSGTSVAKEASDITLLDDSFASIVNAIMWGRSVYLNIQRFVLFQLTINVAALLIVLLSVMLGFELPLTVTQMLWVNLIMDTFAAGALASLPADKRVMKNKPRKSSEFIITKTMGSQIIWTGIAFVVGMIGLLFLLEHLDGGQISLQSQTLFFTVFVMLQFWNMFNAKAYRSGRIAIAAIGKAQGFITVGLLIILGQILIVSFGGEVFRVEPLTLTNWLVAIGATSVVLWTGEIGRLIGRKK